MDDLRIVRWLQMRFASIMPHVATARPSCDLSESEVQEPAYEYQSDPPSRVNSWFLGNFPRIDKNAYLTRLRFFGVQEPSHEARAYEAHLKGRLSHYNRLRFARLIVIGITGTTVSALMLLTT